MRTLYIAAFVFSFQVALTAYVNSSLLETSVGENGIGILYAIASITSIVGLVFIPHIIRKIGNKHTMVGVLIASAAILGLIVSHAFFIPLLVFYIAANTMTFFLFDIFIEHYAKIKTMGASRGTYLTIINLGWIASPMIAGWLSTQGGFETIYIVAMFFILATALIIGSILHTFKDTNYRRENMGTACYEVANEPHLRRIFSINFALQFFYAWMVIYAPIYLHQTIGLGWETIGILFTIMLVPFIFFEYPVGWLLDKGFSPRKILSFGLVCMITALFLFVPAATHSVVAIGAILFLSRVGSSIVESTSEVLFFKHVSKRHADVISLYRDAHPCAYLIAPLAGTAIIAFFQIETLFGVLGCLLGLLLLYIAFKRRYVLTHPHQ